MNKKIGLLTLPLWNNYGGILQCYALKTSVEKLGYEVFVIDMQKSPQSKLDILSTHLKNLIKRQMKNRDKLNLSQTDSFRKAVSVNTRHFVENELKPLIGPVYCDGDIHGINSKLDGVIVGSDQVWRPDYAPSWSHYFLNFLGNNKLRVAYAASFGKDYCSLTSEQSNITVNALSRFNGISVREDSGVKIVKEQFGFDCQQVLDPTLLLDKTYYIDLAKKYNTKESEGNLFTYILDHNELSNLVIKSVTQYFGLEAFEVNCEIPKVNFDKNKMHEHIYPDISQWIQAFIDADFVIADSFHGCVFAIIFNKPFIAIGNVQRGLTRFDSLLKTFGLESRLVLSFDDVTEDVLDYEFDWESINKKRDVLIQNSIEFLNNALSSEIINE